MEQIKVVVVNPGEAPEVRMIPNKLEAFQGIVDGHIESALYIGKNIALICNEEGKLLQLPFNKNLPGGRDYLVGPVFFTKIDKHGNNISLTERDITIIFGAVG